jgi:hypothetical protein
MMGRQHAAGVLVITGIWRMEGRAAVKDTKEHIDRCNR